VIPDRKGRRVCKDRRAIRDRRARPDWQPLFHTDGTLQFDGRILDPAMTLTMTLPAGRYEVTTLASIQSNTNFPETIMCELLPDENGIVPLSLLLPPSARGTLPMLTTFTGPGSIAISCTETGQVESYPIPIVGRIVAVKAG
jgi:hypothetical protein